MHHYMLNRAPFSFLAPSLSLAHCPCAYGPVVNCTLCPTHIVSLFSLFLLYYIIKGGRSKQTEIGKGDVWQPVDDGNLVRVWLVPIAPFPDVVARVRLCHSFRVHVYVLGSRSDDLRNSCFLVFLVFFSFTRGIDPRFIFPFARTAPLARVFPLKGGKDCRSLKLALFLSSGRDSEWPRSG